jgi:hypothetical protein
MGTIADGDTLRGVLSSGINATDVNDYDLAYSLTRGTTRIVKLTADGAAATATANLTFDAAPRQIRLVRAFWISEAIVTADNTNFGTIVLSKRTGGGADVVMASLATTIAAPGSGNLAVGVAVPLVLSTVGGAIIMAANDSFRFGITKSGTGVVIAPGLLAIVVETL